MHRINLTKMAFAVGNNLKKSVKLTNKNTSKNRILGLFYIAERQLNGLEISGFRYQTTPRQC